MLISPGRSRRSTGSSSKKSGSGGNLEYYQITFPTPKTEEQMNRIKQSVGMNRSEGGKANAIVKLYNDGTITEAEMDSLFVNFFGELTEEEIAKLLKR